MGNGNDVVARPHDDAQHRLPLVELDESPFDLHGKTNPPRTDLSPTAAAQTLSISAVCIIWSLKRLQLWGNHSLASDWDCCRYGRSFKPPIAA